MRKSTKSLTVEKKSLGRPQNGVTFEYQTHLWQQMLGKMDTDYLKSKGYFITEKAQIF